MAYHHLLVSITIISGVCCDLPDKYFSKQRLCFLAVRGLPTRRVLRVVQMPPVPCWYIQQCHACYALQCMPLVNVLIDWLYHLRYLQRGREAFQFEATVGKVACSQLGPCHRRTQRRKVCVRALI
jgi:hypothetical protein